MATLYDNDIDIQKNNRFSRVETKCMYLYEPTLRG